MNGIASSPDGIGVLGLAISSPTIGVMGVGSGNGYGISRRARPGRGQPRCHRHAHKGGGGFRIDHPLDPANKFLSHSFVESPDMKNIYDGVAKLDSEGEATVELPDWFEALNRDFRYQLTPIGEYSPLFVRSKVEVRALLDRRRRRRPGGELAGHGHPQGRLGRGEPDPRRGGQEGRRKGRYLHPEEHGQKASKGIKLPKAAQRAMAKPPKAPKAPKLAS